MLQQDRPEDYVVATGETHTVGTCSKRLLPTQAWITAIISRLIQTHEAGRGAPPSWGLFEGSPEFGMASGSEFRDIDQDDG